MSSQSACAEPATVSASEGRCWAKDRRCSLRSTEMPVLLRLLPVAVHRYCSGVGDGNEDAAGRDGNEDAASSDVHDGASILPAPTLRPEALLLRTSFMIASLTEGVRLCQFAAKLADCLVHPAYFRPATRSHIGTIFGESTLGIRDAGAIPAASTFCELTSSSDTSRQVTSQAATAQEVATHGNEGESRQQAASSVMPRPMTATKTATDGLEADRDLAIVVAAWPNLSDSVRASVMRIIKGG